MLSMAPASVAAPLYAGMMTLIVTSRLSDLGVLVDFLLENPRCNEGQPPDILLKSAVSAEKRPKIGVFSPRSEVQAACLKGRVHFFDDFSCFKLRLHSKSDRLLRIGQCIQGR